MAETVRFGAFEGVLEEVRCPLCGPEASRSLVHRTRQGVGFHLCGTCGLMYASPRFTEASLLKIYETEAFQPNLDSFQSWTWEDWSAKRSREYQVSRLKVDLLNRHLEPGSRVLDVGCGVGLTVAVAVREGYRCEGVEPSAMLSGVARERLKVPVTTGQIETFRPPHAFRGIIVWDVLEHVFDPARLLRRCAELLEPGGLLFAQVPHHRGLSNSLKTALCRLGLRGDEFKHFGFPWHIYSFDRKSLRAATSAAGLKAEGFEAWSSELKDGRRGPLARWWSDFNRGRCWSDYIVCVARKGSDPNN